MRLALLILMWLAPTLLFAQNSSQYEFDEANTKLENGDYKNALQQYRTIIADGEESGALYLNMGIAAVQLDSLGLAKYYFTRALAFDTAEQEANTALDFVNSQFSRQSATLPKLPWDKLVDILKVSPGTFGVFMIGYIILCIAVLLLLAKWFNFISFKKLPTLIMSIAGVGMVVLILAFYVDYVDQRYDEAILITEQSSVTQKPDSTSTLVSMAYEGYPLTIDQSVSEGHSDWYYVRLGNGLYGWIKKSGILKL